MYFQSSGFLFSGELGEHYIGRQLTFKNNRSAQSVGLLVACHCQITVYKLQSFVESGEEGTGGKQLTPTIDSILGFQRI